MRTATPKKQFNIRLDRTTLAEIIALQKELRVSQAAVISLAIRSLYRQEKNGKRD